jgi:hypothetical protein
MQTAIYGVAIVPVLVGIVQVLKETGLPGRFAPVVSLVLGILAGVALQFASAATGTPLTGPTVIQGVVIGVTLGLSASGVYSGVSAYVAPKVADFTASIEGFPPVDPPPAAATEPAPTEPSAA